jgi:DNA invertase Pin-like site-specific DNA recombinase
LRLGVGISAGAVPRGDEITYVAAMALLYYNNIGLTLPRRSHKRKARIAEAEMAPSTRWIAYFRVSDQKQGRSGLGLEAQQAAVVQFLEQNGGRLLSTYREVESGDDADRPMLQRAINDCRLRKAVLLVAKIDRLSRDIHFLTGLQKAGVKFRAADMPDCNELVVHILISVAQHELEMIRSRTKAALAAAKARGVRLGNPKGLTPEARARGPIASLKARRAAVSERLELLTPVVEDIRDAGHTSLTAIAAELNAREIAAPRGGNWGPAQVSRLLEQIGCLPDGCLSHSSWRGAGQSRQGR